jgi:hypothetical protein
MRYPSLLALAAAALTVSACATATPDAPAGTVSSGSPAPVEGYDWFFNTDEDAARLAYGLADSDDLRLGLDCTRASGRLSLSGVADAPAKPEFLLEAGGETERFPARSEPSELHDGVFLSADAAADAPVFQRFRRVGWLAIWADGVRETYAPHPSSVPNIERFFAFCG